MIIELFQILTKLEKNSKPWDFHNFSFLKLQTLKDIWIHLYWVNYMYVLRKLIKLHLICCFLDLDTTNIIWEIGIPLVLLETDSVVAVNPIQAGDTSIHIHLLDVIIFETLRVGLEKALALRLLTFTRKWSTLLNLLPSWHLKAMSRTCAFRTTLSQYLSSSSASFFFCTLCFLVFSFSFYYMEPGWKLES